MSVISPLDPLEGHIYVELLREKHDTRELENIYKMTSSKDDYVSPIVDGNFNWHSINSCASCLDKGLDN